MRCTLAFLIICSSVLASKHVVNYCGSKMCSHTNSHTFCQFGEGPGPNCKGYIEANLTTDEKARIIARLNQRRNAVASGRLPGFPTAGNMLKLRWVEELSREAQRWADQCQPPETPEAHDDCRDLYSITVGQCVASVVGEAPGLRPESMVDMWYMQNMHYKVNVTSYVESTYTGYYGDFAQLIWAQSYMVGCGRSRFMTPRHSRLRSAERLVCNFAPRGPNEGRPLWTPAAPAAACPPRSMPDDQWTSLCSYRISQKSMSQGNTYLGRTHESIVETILDESHDIDNSMSSEDHILLNTVFDIENNVSLNYIGSLDEIYLTNVAIATMHNSHTTPWNFNSVRKRDTDELFELLENKSIEHIIIATDETEIYPNTTKEAMPKINETSKPIKLLTPKLSFIGRPKSYNMEELNDDTASLNVRNHYDKTSNDVPIHEKDLYAEYEFFDTLEENTSTTYEEPTTISIENTTQDIHIERKNREVIEPSTEVSVRRETLSTNLSVYLMNSNEPFNDTMEGIPKAVEDYLSDPETVRILQEELDRMEKSMSPSTHSPGKVRRELRQLPQELNDQKYQENKLREERELIILPLENGQQEILSEDRNSTEDRGPMLNMVLRYMPYLKDYKQTGVGTSATSISPSPSFLLVYVCMFNFVV